LPGSQPNFVAAVHMHRSLNLVQPARTSEVDVAAAVACSLVDMVAASGTADGGVAALDRAGDGQTLTASTCGSAINF
jgi:hypothetical protein